MNIQHNPANLVKIPIRHLIKRTVVAKAHQSTLTSDLESNVVFPTSTELKASIKPVLSKAKTPKSKITKPEMTKALTVKDMSTNQLLIPEVKWIPKKNLDFEQGQKKRKICASFDVGVKHLAYCVLSYDETDKSFEVYDWGIINLLTENEDYDRDTLCCNYLIASTGKPCGHRASFIKRSDGNLNMNNDLLRQTAGKKVSGLCGTHAKKESQAEAMPELPNVNTMDVQVLCEGMVKQLDKYTMFLEVDEILIEEQPRFGSLKGNKWQSGPSVHPRMGHLSYMIYSYFVTRGIVDKERNASRKSNISAVRLVSSANKLKVYDGPAIEVADMKPYERNKFLAKEHVRYILKDKGDLISFFNTYKKQDDLADCFLQGAYVLKGAVSKPKAKRTKPSKVKTAKKVKHDEVGQQVQPEP